VLWLWPLRQPRMCNVVVVDVAVDVVVVVVVVDFINIGI
jgi:hypothetical protein